MRSPEIEKLWQTKFEIHGKGDPKNEPAAMLRTLLRDRFGLRTHTEVRQLPVYALVVKEPGRLGPGLKPSPHNCREFVARGGKRGDLDAPPMCFPQSSPDPTRGGGTVSRYAGTIADFIERELYSLMDDRPVIDATGLAGNYEWKFSKAGALGEMFAIVEDLGLRLDKRVGPWKSSSLTTCECPLRTETEIPHACSTT